MATFNVTIGAYANQAPTQTGSISFNIAHADTIVFTKANFTTGTVPPYEDPEGDDLEAIKILTLPATGVLNLSAVPVLVNDEIAVADIVAGNLTYVSDDLTATAYTDTFTFDVSDLGSSTFGGLTGTVNVNVAAEVNQPPSEVGDGSASVDYGETLVFTRAMFTSATTPPYADPEGDAAGKLKITGLPILGKIQFNGSDVAVNVIINFTDIDAGLLTYVPDLADTDGDIQGFTFEIADVGSNVFVA